MKECNICHKPEVFIIVNTVDREGNVQELALCKDCAQKKGISEIKKIKLTPAEIIMKLQMTSDANDQKITCNFCNITWANFRTTGRLGCEHCYESFKNQLDSLIKEIHGATLHRGKTVTSGRKTTYDRFVIKKLTKQMRQAIQNEDYEKAAVIRDQITKIKKGIV
ncbi:MAG: UvrB/UvrC motif-containing protein [candidate division WOR-3 bacterium]